MNRRSLHGIYRRMPRLENQRQERFCQLIKQGIPPFRAYPLAGYKPHNGEPYRLRDNPRVKARIRELTRHIAVKTRVTIETLTEELNDAAAVARAAEQPGAMVQAITTKAKLHGLLIDRKESGAPGEFSNATSADEVLDLVRKELGDEMADALAGVLAKRSDGEDDQPQLEPTRDPDASLN